MAELLAPGHEIYRIRYFTAWVEGEDRRRRQLTYIRALGTLPNLYVTQGSLKTREKRGPLTTPIPGAPHIVTISTHEEKGSDVTLATYQLADGYDKEYEQAIVVSNDSDLALPIKMAREKFGRVGVVNPNRNPKSSTPKELIDAASFTLRLYKQTLRASQFPQTLQDAKGRTISKPPLW